MRQQTITAKQARTLLSQPPQKQGGPPPGIADTDKVTGPCVTCGHVLKRAGVLSLCHGCGKPNTGTVAYQRAVKQYPELTPDEYHQAARDQWDGVA